MKARFVIGLDGSVTSAVATKDPNTPAPRVTDGVVHVFATLKLPPPRGGKVTVIYPLSFTSKD